MLRKPYGPLNVLDKKFIPVALDVFEVTIEVRHRQRQAGQQILINSCFVIDAPAMSVPIGPVAAARFPEDRHRPVSDTSYYLRWKRAAVNIRGPLHDRERAARLQIAALSKHVFQYLF